MNKLFSVIGGKFKFQVQDIDLEYSSWRFDKHIALSEKKLPLDQFFFTPSQKLYKRFNHSLKLARFEGLKPSRGFEKHARDVTSSSKSDLFLSSSANYRSRNKSQFQNFFACDDFRCVHYPENYTSLDSAIKPPFDCAFCLSTHCSDIDVNFLVKLTH